MQIRSTLFAALLAAGMLATTCPASAAEESVSFDGVIDRLQVFHHDELNPGGAIAIEAWVRPSHLNTFQTIVGKDYCTGIWFGINPGGTLRFYNRGLGTWHESLSSIPANEWTHVAVDYNGQAKRFYINGERDQSVIFGDELANNVADLGIGGEASEPSCDSFHYEFAGLISEVRLWGVRRQEADIRRFMYRQITEPQPGLIAVWPLEGGFDDRFGMHQAYDVESTTASFIAPPTTFYNPMPIPQFASSVTFDGRCDGIYWDQAQPVPIWYDEADIQIVGLSNPVQALVMASDAYLFICLDPAPFANIDAFRVSIDVDGSADNLPNVGDWRFSVTRDPPGPDTTSVQVGNGSSWVAASPPAGFLVASTNPTEFTWGVEMRIPRSEVFGSTWPTTPSRIRINHHRTETGPPIVITDHGWPDDTDHVAPFTWEPVIVDPSPPPVSDSRRPFGVIVHLSSERPRPFEPVQMRATAEDDKDLSHIDVLIDGSVVHTCEFPGPANRVGVCQPPAEVHDLGLHSVQAIAYDHRGLQGYSPVRYFRVIAAGRAPVVEVSVSPRNPAPGQMVAVTATARDTSGLTFIQVREPFGSIFPSFFNCPLGGAPTLASCVWNVMPPAGASILRFDALATDVEGLNGTSPQLPVLFGNTGPDSDQDGVTDAFESRFCTSASDPDSDRDGLSDGWEIVGVEFMSLPYYNLPADGVHPCVRDVLFQLDYEEGGRPPQIAFDNLRAEYRSHGVRLRLEEHERLRPIVYPLSHFGSKHAIYQDDDGDYYFDPRRNWFYYYGYQRHVGSVGAAWGRLFTMGPLDQTHGYCFGGDRDGEGCLADFDCPNGGVCGAGCDEGSNASGACNTNADCPKVGGGLARCSIPCQCWPNLSDPTQCVSMNPALPACGYVTDSYQAYTVIHELGHAVGLGHGGRTGTRAPSINNGFVTLDNAWDNDNFKPTHRSVMNYFYNGAELCMQPLGPDLSQTANINLKQSYLDLPDILGNVTETALQESGSTVATRLRNRDCSWAGADAVPVMRHTCTRAGERYQVLTDGDQIIQWAVKDGGWTRTVPAQTGSGIDWDCDRVIEGGTVPSNIDGSGGIGGALFAGDATVWTPRSAPLLNQGEWQSIPNPPACQIPYDVDCETPAESCHLMPQAYANQIGVLATGLAPIKCRAQELAIRRCPEVPEGSFPDVFCTDRLVWRDLPVPEPPQLIELQAMAVVEGPDAAVPLESRAEEADLNPVPPPPIGEFCNLQDDDDDGSIDEGCADADFDGAVDVLDNCPGIFNPLQEDINDNALGDECETSQPLDVQANPAPDGSITLSWNQDVIPVMGFALYRDDGSGLNQSFLGQNYPSTMATQWTDSPPGYGVWTYYLRAVNLLGDEGPVVTVQADNSAFAPLFEDGFE